MEGRWPVLMTKEEAAEYLSCSIDTIKRLNASGEIRTVMLRGLFRYRRSELNHLVDQLEYGRGKQPKGGNP